MSINAKEFTEDEVFSLLQPEVAEWFKNKYKHFTPPQLMAIPLIKQGKNVLVSSPTGSGKTLAAFLGIIDSLIDLEKKGSLENYVYAVYISPLRALNNDMRRNLLEPLNELKQLYRDLPSIKIGVRTSDTTPYEKQKMLRDPPHILITTPESFALSITSPKFKDRLRNTKWIIIDEIHELANSKRGAYLSGLVEIFESLIVQRPLIRIGLSATVAPLEEVAKFLVGKNRPYEIVDARFVKPLDIKVIVPVKDLVHATEEEISDGIYKKLISEIKRHRTTLIFTNTRSAAERVAYKIRKIIEKEKILEDVDSIEAHHSSLSRDIRLEVEEKLKRGELKAVVSSTSLELGIDIGYIDLVILLSSPKSVSRLLQRIGRAGHHIREISKGELLVVDRDDLVECTVLAELARQRKIDNIHIPVNPLDVLSQLIIASSLIKPEITKTELYNIITSSYNFSLLTWKDFEDVLEYLGGNFELEDKGVYSKIRLYDNVIKLKKGTRMIFTMNSGTIPDEAKIAVFTDANKYVGNLEEEFAEILSPGDIFVLGGRTYEFLTSKGNKVIVHPADGQRPTVPSWFSEMLPLAYDSALEVGKFRGEVSKIIDTMPLEKAIDYISRKYHISKDAAFSMYQYIYEEKMFTGGIIPTDKLILIEIYDDEENRRNFIFHSLYGRRTVDALSRAVAYVISNDTGMDVKISVTDNGFIITLPEIIDYPLASVFDKLDPNILYDTLSRVISRTEMLKRRFRHCAERSFMLLKRYKGRETSIDRRQLNAEVLLKAVSEIKDFPVLKEAIREILEDYMDIKHAIEVLSKIKNGEIRIKVIGPNNVPSPFSHSILLKEYSDVVLAEDKRKLLQQLHDKVVEFLRNKGINIDLKYTTT